MSGPSLLLESINSMIFYTYRKSDIAGLECDDPRTSIKLVFHAIIPLPFWQWDNKSCIYMRFGHPKLGNWNVDCGEFEVAR